MKDSRKKVYFGLLFILLAYISFKLVLSGDQWEAFQKAVKNIDPIWLVPASLCSAGFFMFQGRNFQKILRTFGYHVSWLSGVRYALIDFYGSCITPGGSGGQPACIAAMAKDGVPVGSGTLSNVLYNMLYHVFMVVLAFVSIFSGVFFRIHNIGAMAFVLWYGLLGQMFISVLYFFLAFSEKMGPNIILWISNRKFVQKRPKLQQHIQGQAEEFKICAKLFKERPKEILSIFITIMMQLLVNYSMLYFLLRGVGVKTNYFFALIVQATCILGFESMPIPGSFGVAESGFLAIYGTYFGAEHALILMILSRVMTLYYGVTAGFIVTVYTTLKERKFLKRSL
ncbi:lysylphosphatidylglycerol synthase transmembrane domain-containing protein [Guggenheimella bovis]